MTPDRFICHVGDFLDRVMTSAPDQFLRFLHRPAGSWERFARSAFKPVDTDRPTDWLFGGFA